MGLSIGVELRRDPSVEVVVLEKSIPGAEASSAAAGMLAPQFESEKPGPMLDLCLLSRAAWPKFARMLEEQSNVPVHYLPSGGLQVAFTDDEVHALQAKIDWQSALGLRATLLSAQELRSLEPAINHEALAAADFPDDHQVDPRRLMRALQVAASRSGVAFRTGTVRGLVEKDGKIIGVDVDGEQLHSDVVVLAAGAWSGLVSGAQVDPSRVKPVRGQMLELQVRAPTFSRLLKGASGYLVPRSDGAIIAGSTMEMAGYEKNVTVEGLAKLLRATQELVPSLASAPITQTWAGLRPWTDDQLPFLGEGPKPGLLLATGHFRNGILLAPITARLIGQLVRREKPTLDLRAFRYARNSP
ncbi:MAG: glycine oxidase ThiO [Archangium gephyra]|uniref:Glycine oxidase ThiO n=1 Tax=Archangium gephyra TaxID=48 RepID=A0A2W5TSW7_9BACT|nr:MAG: glycine oxidase ThiO [Archangium gephyra]